MSTLFCGETTPIFINNPSTVSIEKGVALVCPLNVTLNPRGCVLIDIVEVSGKISINSVSVNPFESVTFKLSR